MRSTAWLRRREFQMKNTKVLLGAFVALASLVLATTAMAAVFIKGTNHDDVLTGTDRNDLIVGLKGNDTINGLAGNDRIHGNQDNDAIDAGPGNDRVFGGYGNDTLDGGDVLHALAHDNQVDHIDCGPGNDVVWLNVKETTDVHVNCETVKTVTVT